jgi:D-sedoheptulose 7-phosphate isomerase
MKEIAALFSEVSASFDALSRGTYAHDVGRAIEMITTAFRAGKKLLVFGNGGSASDAQHICGELVGRFKLERRGLPAIALTENSAVLTAWANDHEYESVFARQIEALGAPGDIAWGISTSGNSRNVVCGMTAARAAGLKTIGMTGEKPNRMKECSDLLLCAPASVTARVQEVHLVTYHAICDHVERQMAQLRPSGAAEV